MAEGIAQRSSDIDIVYVYGYGFPVWRGGPMHYADRMGLKTVLKKLEALAATGDPMWQPAPLIRELAAEGKSFADLVHAQ